MTPSRGYRGSVDAEHVKPPKTKNKPNPPAIEVIEDVRHEVNRAIVKHGWELTPLNPSRTDQENFVVLVEEVGEVARAMTYDESDDIMLYQELIQVAAMAMAWATARYATVP